MAGQRVWAIVQNKQAWVQPSGLTTLNFTLDPNRDPVTEEMILSKNKKGKQAEPVFFCR